MSRVRAVIQAAAVLAALLVAPGAAADWLVLTDGSRVETRGAWEEKGRLVVFETTDGELASLRATEVDLAASREATAEALRPPAEAAPAEAEAPRRATRRITNSDIPAGAPRPEPPSAAGEAAGEITGEAAEAGAAGGPSRRRGEASPVSVSAWDLVSEPGESLTFRGTVRNGSDRVTAAAIGLQVELMALDGEPLGTRAASVRPSTLPAGATATFEVTFDDVYDYGALRFEVESISLRQGGAGEEASEEAGEGEGEATGGSDSEDVGDAG